MHNNYFSFNSAQDESVLQSLALAINGIRQNAFVRIPDALGKGVIYRKVVEPGFVFLSWNLDLNQNFIIRKRPALTSPAQEFVMSFVIRGERVQLVGPHLKKRLSITLDGNILMLSRYSDLTFFVPAGDIFQVIDIGITIDWLRSAMSGEQGDYVDYFSRQFGQNDPRIVVEKMNLFERQSLTKLVVRNADAVHSPLAFKSELMLVVSQFLNRIFNETSRDSLKSRFVKYDKMLEVAEYLKTHLEGNLPELDKIAKDKAMSVSTLKRHFKHMFGKNIYDYYLSLKMQHAHHLITNANLSVSEVASRLHYENTSNFIQTFRKYYGVSPGALRK